MRPPGDRLRSIALRLCAPHGMDRVMDPVISDVRTEYAEAMRQRNIWRGRWICLVGCVTFWKVLTLHAAMRAVPVTREWIADDDDAIGRTLTYSTVAITGITLFFVILPLWTIRNSVTAATAPRLLVGLMARALSVGVPVGVATGIVAALGGHHASRRIRRAILLMGSASCVLMFVLVAWILPVANSTFRELGAQRPVMRGPRELTINEPGSKGARLEYHERWAASLATVVLGTFAYAVATATRFRLASIMIGVVGSILYWFSFVLVALPVFRGWIPPFAGAWIPNVLYSVFTTVLITRGSGADPGERYRSHSTLVGQQSDLADFTPATRSD